MWRRGNSEIGSLKVLEVLAGGVAVGNDAAGELGEFPRADLVKDENVKEAVAGVGAVKHGERAAVVASVADEHE